MDLEEGASRAPFLLADKKEEEIVAVALALVAILRLTIVPSIPSGAVSGDWTMGGMESGHHTLLAVSTRASCLHGGGLISLALTEAPSLASFSLFTGGGGRGGFGGLGGENQGSSGATMWSPLTDRHAQSELRCIPLVLVRNDKAEFCLGCIGMDEWRFCCSTSCNIMSHCKHPHVLECQEGYHITTVGQKFQRQPSTFRTPFLDALHLTPEVRAIVTDTGEAGMKTTSKREEFIMQAKVARHVFHEAVCVCVSDLQ
jgi:hypothetical protein